jgi:ArsR family transcriptional regulator
MVTLTTHPMHDSSSHSSEPLAATRGDLVPALGSLGEATTTNLVQLFKLLSDETRLKILNYLMQKDELNVRTLCKLLRQSQPAVSHHLALLRVAGIIECRRDGKHNFYHLVPKRCQEYLDTIFGVTGDQVRKVRVEDAVLTYSRDQNAGKAAG